MPSAPIKASTQLGVSRTVAGKLNSPPGQEGWPRHQGNIRRSFEGAAGVVDQPQKKLFVRSSPKFPERLRLSPGTRVSSALENGFGNLTQLAQFCSSKHLVVLDPPPRLACERAARNFLTRSVRPSWPGGACPHRRSSSTLQVAFFHVYRTIWKDRQTLLSTQMTDARRGV